MTEKEMDKEHLQEELESEIHDEKSNKTQLATHDNANPEENPSESIPEPEPEVTLRDVVEVLREGFSTLSGKLDSIEDVLKGIKSSIGMLRGEISEWALLDTIVDYLKEKEGEREFIVKRVPRTGRRGADWLLETGKRYYIIETKTYLDDKILRKAINQIEKEARKLPDNKEIWGIVAARFSEIRPGVLLLKFGPRGSRRTIPIYIFSYDVGEERFKFLNKGE